MLIIALLLPALGFASELVVDVDALARARAGIVELKSAEKKNPSSVVLVSLRKRCHFQRIEKNDCVYRCTDGSTYRSPVREPGPMDPPGTPVIACPQIVFPF